MESKFHITTFIAGVDEYEAANLMLEISEWIAQIGPYAQKQDFFFKPNEGYEPNLELPGEAALKTRENQELRKKTRSTFTISNALFQVNRIRKSKLLGLTQVYPANQSSLYVLHTCSLCGKKFIAATFLARHMHLKHGDANSKRYKKEDVISTSVPKPCRNRSLKIFRALHDNLSAPDKKWQCKSCRKTFSSLLFLKKHLALF